MPSTSALRPSRRAAGRVRPRASRRLADAAPTDADAQKKKRPVPAPLSVPRGRFGAGPAFQVRPRSPLPTSAPPAATRAISCLDGGGGLLVSSAQKQKEQMVASLYAEYNERVFGGVLPAKMSVTWNARLNKTAGLTYLTVRDAALRDVRQCRLTAIGSGLWDSALLASSCPPRWSTNLVSPAAHRAPPRALCRSRPARSASAADTLPRDVPRRGLVD
jgi:hypothetical protein